MGRGAAMFKSTAKKFEDDFSIHQHHAAGIEIIVPDPALSHEANLIAQLRHEANQEKDAFGWHAFQALSISSVALGSILYFMFSREGFASVGLAALPILVFALVTCRLGDSCYSSANRHYGYELFLYRVRTSGGHDEGRWHQEYRSIEWEAAMRAWRVVQASLYEAIYRPGNYLTIDRLKSQFDMSKKAFWFCQSSLSKQNGAKFHAGSYLSRMHAMLLLVAVASVAILWATVLAVIFRPFGLTEKTPAGATMLHQMGLPVPSTASLNVAVLVLCLAVAIAATIVFYVRFKAENAKRLIMEDGILSIHASSIVWQAVVVAHFSTLARARESGLTSWKLSELLRKAKSKHRREWNQWKRGAMKFETLLAKFPEPERGPRDPGAGVSGYTFWLAEEAASLARCAADVPGWIGVGEDELRRRGTIV